MIVHDATGTAFEQFAVAGAIDGPSGAVALRADVRAVLRRPRQAIKDRLLSERALPLAVPGELVFEVVGVLSHVDLPCSLLAVRRRRSFPRY